ncbi:right-handed parallel beta-helix repeat-containing protein [Anaeromyxobacter sp. SG66]|uniref:right-handed parallel beta-helix repeat-containing protein n=1 Tax=Anaeromyxobacter sp. SG66 TaxID=2925410 RepID=UPI001F5A7ED6|nr:right-handed parallel beta-helix repeat-containing protein [Anaeromyxobacter sp. SG66]
MRRLLPLVLLALAACQVDVEGAPCRGLGQATEDCPGGQGCGLDQRCSKRAAASSCALCTPDAVRCKPLQPGATAPGEPGKIQQCDATGDPVCGAWVTRTTCAEGLVCGEKSGAPSCECPANAGAQYVVAAPGSVDGGGPAPTGADTPAQCRFRSLTEAIGVAAPAGGTVIAKGGASGEHVAFGSATGEVLPLDLPAGVTLTSDSSGSGAEYAILLDDAAATAAVRMHAGATLAGFAIENVVGDATRDVDALELACDGSSAPVNLQSVALRGTSATDDQKKLARGLSVKDTCGVTAADVVIAGMATDALHVEAANPAVTTTFLRGALRQSGRGAHLTQGVLKLDGVTIEENAGMGIEAGSSTNDAALELNAVKVLRNDDTGIAAMNTTRLFIVDSTIFGNGIGASATVWGPPTYVNSTGTTRKCGGIVLIGAPPPAAGDFRFERNRVYANRGDQVLVMLSSSGPWPLGATACGTTSTDTTVFGCYDPSSSGSIVSYRGLVVIDAPADASRIAWGSGQVFPAQATDFKAFGGSVSLAGTPWYCMLPAVLDCSSPDPK